MSVADRLEASIAFLQANLHGKHRERSKSFDGKTYAYCARGAVIYGGFADVSARWCDDYAEWQEFPCSPEGCTADGAAAPNEFDQVMDALDSAAAAEAGCTSVAITEYNDYSERTKEQVLRVFQAAAEAEHARARKATDGV